MKHIIIILASIVMSANIFAQEQNTVITGTLTGATPTVDIQFGSFTSYDDVFYKFTPTVTSLVSIELNYDDNDIDNSRTACSSTATNTHSVPTTNSVSGFVFVQ